MRESVLKAKLECHETVFEARDAVLGDRRARSMVGAQGRRSVEGGLGRVSKCAGGGVMACQKKGIVGVGMAAGGVIQPHFVFADVVSFVARGCDKMNAIRK